MSVPRSSLMIGVFLLAACGGATDLPDGATESPVTSSSTSTPDSLDPVSPDTSAGSQEPSDLTSPGSTFDQSLVPFIDQAVTDLATRLGQAESSIEIASASLVTWSDASLGCPQPGMQYAQVLTDGALIELVAEGQTYSYHMGGNEFEPFLCGEPKAPVEGDAGSGNTETRSTPYGDLVYPITEDTVPPPGYDD